MTPLTQEKSVACRADSPKVTEEEIAELHPQVPDWQLTIEDGIQKLARVYRFRNFAQALASTNAVGSLAESEGHHPRMVTEWGWTSPGGLTRSAGSIAMTSL